MNRALVNVEEIFVADGHEVLHYSGTGDNVVVTLVDKAYLAQIIGHLVEDGGC